MGKDEYLLKYKALIFGFWQQGNDEYYFGQIGDDQVTGELEIKYANGQTEVKEYSIGLQGSRFHLQMSNIEYVIVGLDERQMRLQGPLDQVMHKDFKKLPNKMTFSF